jgi:UDP-glucose 4-epimerase
MKILVTGGAGFIGSHLTERLVREGHDVRVLDNFSTGRKDNLADIASSIELTRGDIRDFQAVRGAVRGIEIVFHDAALCSVARSVDDPQTTNAVNIDGTLNVLSAARDEKVRRVICASSSSVYGNNPALPKQENQTPAPASPYAVTKYNGELYCRVFHQIFGLETISLRYFNVFGPRQVPDSQYSAVIPKFITAILRGEPPVIFGDGGQSRDFSYVANVVEANLMAMKATKGFGEAFNVACGERTNLLQLVDYLIKMSGSPVQPVHRDNRAGDVRHSLADLAKAESLLGYHPIVPFLTGLERTFEWYRSQIKSPAAVGAA